MHIFTFSRKYFTDKLFILWTAALLAGGLALAPGSQAHATDLEQRLQTQRAMPVQSNEVPEWPNGPVTSAESAILIESQTGTVLYSKNIHQRQYPASTTKILTALIASELCEMDETVTFSHDAVFDTPRDSTHIAMDVGQELTMEQCMQALLIRSANEVAYAMAEHITGSTDWQVFGDVMNTRAQELGCLNSHFANPNGLPDENHYTTAYDLAMIGRAFFSNEALCKITLTRRFEFPATDKLPQTKIENNLMKLIPGGEYAYEYLVGCKTGFTATARSSLVACAEKNGMKLICVVMHDEAPYQYEDVISLFEYGFANFEKVNVAQNETRYNIENTGLFYSGNDIFGSSQPLLSLDKNDYIVLPKAVSFEELETTVSFDSGSENQAAVVSYSYHGVNVGSARVNISTNEGEAYVFDALPIEEEEAKAEASTLFINLKLLWRILAVAGGVLLVILFVRIILKYYSFSGKSGRRRRRRRRRKWRWKRRTKWLDD